MEAIDCVLINLAVNVLCNSATVAQTYSYLEGISVTNTIKVHNCCHLLPHWSTLAQFDKSKRLLSCDPLSASQILVFLSLRVSFSCPPHKDSHCPVIGFSSTWPHTKIAIRELSLARTRNAQFVRSFIDRYGALVLRSTCPTHRQLFCLYSQLMALSHSKSVCRPHSKL